MRTDLPLIARLTPDRPPELGRGFELFESPIRGGLPHTLTLFPRWRVVLSVPTGVARPWLDRDPFEPLDQGAPRLRFQKDNVTVCVIPLVKGPPFKVTTPNGATPLDVLVVDWNLHVGDMRGPGDYGSYLKLAVAVADRAVSSFGPVPISDFVIPALPKEDRTESKPGTSIPMRFRRLQQLRLYRVEGIR